MPAHLATTVAEAEAQTLSLPARLDDWRTFAATINGYTIAKELGFDLSRWSTQQFETWKTTATWTLNLLELRMVLFAAFRADYFSGYTYHEHDAMADSLLRAISAETGLPYPSSPDA